MAKFQSPLLGFNNNVRHKNRVFHIQTEDSGVNHPHIITHLFMDGGRILKSVKKSYAEHVGTEGMKEVVRGLMKDQHKAIFTALRDGQFDVLVDGGTAPKVAAAPLVEPLAAAHDGAPAPAEAEPAEAAEEPAEAAEEPAEVSDRTVVAPAAHLEAVEADATPPSGDGPATIDERDRAPAPSVPPAQGPRVATLKPPPVHPVLVTPETRPDVAAASARELTLDFGALEHVTESMGVPSLFHGDLPPPPKNLFTKESGTGAYRTVEADADPRQEPASTTARRENTRRASSKPPARGTRERPASRPPTEARYAPARPAAIFGSTQRPPPASLFNDDLVSDKSLDEVILSYLAEDLEPPHRK